MKPPAEHIEDIDEQVMALLLRIRAKERNTKQLRSDALVLSLRINKFKDWTEARLRNEIEADKKALAVALDAARSMTLKCQELQAINVERKRELEDARAAIRIYEQSSFISQFNSLKAELTRIYARLQQFEVRSTVNLPRHRKLGIKKPAPAQSQSGHVS